MIDIDGDLFVWLLFIVIVVSCGGLYEYLEKKNETNITVEMAKAGMEQRYVSVTNNGDIESKMIWVKADVSSLEKK